MDKDAIIEKQADEITKTIIHKIPDKQVRRRGLTPLAHTESVLQQIDLPKQLFDVIDHREAINIKKRFVDGQEKRYFLFLKRQGVSPTNNATEQAIRFVIIDRRVTQGTRSWAGMRWSERSLRQPCEG